MNIFYSDNIDSNTIQLSKTESHHCMHVMRMKLNDIVQVLDGNGNRYTCKIINNKSLSFNLVCHIFSHTNWQERK